MNFVSSDLDIKKNPSFYLSKFLPIIPILSIFFSFLKSPSEMDPSKNNNFNPQNPYNFPFNFNNPNNYQFDNQSSNQPRPQQLQNFGYPPNFMPSAVPNFNPYYGMQFPPPSFNSNPYMPPMRNENVPSSQASDYPEYSTQMGLDSMSGANADSPTPETPEGPSTARKKGGKWSTNDNLVLISGWIKFGTDSIVGKNQKGESFWGKIAEYCNEFSKFDPPRDGSSCRNHFNYINKILGRWIGIHDSVTRVNKSGWSEDDILAKCHELYKDSYKGNFTMMSEWHSLRFEPRFASQFRGNTGSDSSGSKRAREGDVGDSGSIGSIPRPIGREAAKKAKKKIKGQEKDLGTEDWSVFNQAKEKEFERLDNIATTQAEANKVKKMDMLMRLKEKEHLDDDDQQLLAMLRADLFGK